MTHYFSEMTLVHDEFDYRYERVTEGSFRDKPDLSIERRHDFLIRDDETFHNYGYVYLIRSETGRHGDFYIDGEVGPTPECEDPVGTITVLGSRRC